MFQGNDSSAQIVVNGLSPFTRLTTLSILPPCNANTDSLYMNILTPQNALRTASLFVQGIPTLTRLAFPLKYPVDETSWHAKSQDVAKAGDIVIGTDEEAGSEHVDVSSPEWII